MVWPIWVVQIIISVVLAVVSYLLTPKPKSDNSDPGQLEGPSSSSSRAVPVVFGTVKIVSPNCLYFGEISTKQVKVK